MTERLDKIREFFAEPGHRLAIYFVIPVIVVAIIAVVAIVMNNSESKPKIRIDNFAKLLPDVPESTRNRIEVLLYEKVEHSGASNIPTSGAMIEADSIDSFMLQTSFTVGEFVVKIDPLDASYRVQYFYGQLENANETEGEASVSIYNMDDYDYEKIEPIRYLLPISFTSDRYSLNSTVSVKSKSGYAVIVTLNPSKDAYLNDSLDSFKAGVTEKVRNFFSHNGLNLDDYEIFYRYKVIR